MQKLLRHLNVFSHFFKYLRVFGMKTFALDEGFSGFDFLLETGSENSGLMRIGMSSNLQDRLFKERKNSEQW
jgi:hypothetical protein